MADKNTFEEIARNLSITDRALVTTVLLSEEDRQKIEISSKLSAARSAFLQACTHVEDECGVMIAEDGRLLHSRA